LPVALGACLLTASLSTGCPNSSGIDPNIKIEEGPTAQESTKGDPRLKSKKAAEPAPEQRRTQRPD
jgi:hypothetical protein